MANCIFCDNKKISKEHLWGAWWKDYYPPSEQDKLIRDSHTITKYDSNNEEVDAKGQFSNVGAPLSATTKVVCEKCNNTWMSQIEAGMKKVFQALYKNNESKISREYSLKIRKWMYLKFCLLDRSYSDFPSTPPKSSNLTKDQVKSIRASRWVDFNGGDNVPEYFNFFISRSTSNYRIGAFNHIPQLFYEVNNLSKWYMADTCMFFNGDFIGIMTDNPNVKKYMFEYESYGLLNPYKQLNNEIQQFYSGNKIYGGILEEGVLSILEKGGTSPLRRNFPANRKISK